MLHFSRDVIFGVVFDLSLRHHADGRRYIDIVKQELIEFATYLAMNCKIYVAHPERHDMPQEQGASVAALSDYLEPIGFSVRRALEQATAMLSAQAVKEAYVVVVSDRYRPDNKHLYRPPNGRCRFVYFSLGHKWDDFGRESRAFRLSPYDIKKTLVEMLENETE